MANLQRIQERIDLIPSLIKEVEAMQPVLTGGPAYTHQSFNVEEVQLLQEHIVTWKSVTSEIVTQEVGYSDQSLFTFNSHWRAPLCNYGNIDGLSLILREVRKYFYKLIAISTPMYQANAAER